MPDPALWDRVRGVLGCHTQPHPTLGLGDGDVQDSPPLYEFPLYSSGDGRKTEARALQQDSAHAC